MCWSPTVSLTLGVAGTATALYAEKIGQPRGFSIPLFYFSLMEFLQFFSYFYLNQCALTGNSSLTLLSYLHIAFQPLFISMFLVTLQTNPVSSFSKKIAYSTALFFTSLMLIRLLPLYPESFCQLGSTMCGKLLCTISGNWHLAWSVPQYNFPIKGDLYMYHALGSFGVPLFLGAWKNVLKTFLIGPVLAFMLTGGNPLEWPAVWCLYSVFIILVILYNSPRTKRKTALI